MSNSNPTKISKRVLAILRDFENQGHDVEMLIQRAIDHLRTEIMLGAIFDTDSKRIVKIREHQIDATRLHILQERLIKMESIRDQWTNLQA